MYGLSSLNRLQKVKNISFVQEKHTVVVSIGVYIGNVGGVCYDWWW